MMVTRVYLARENRKREEEPYDASHDEVYITETREDGTKEEVRVDKVSLCSLFCVLWFVVLISDCRFVQAFLDLTDIENREFRYVL